MAVSNRAEATSTEPDQELERFRLLEQVSQEAIVVFDEQFRCLWVSAPLLRICNYREDELIGRPGSDFVTPEYRDLTKNHLQHNHLEPFEAMLYRGDGSSFPALIQASRAEYQGREVRVLSFHDITSSKRQQIRYEQAYAELSSIFNHSMTGIIQLDSKRIIHRSNRRFAEIFGYASPAELEGQSISLIYLSREEFEEVGRHYKSTLLEKGLVEFEQRYRRKDGTVLWAKVVGKAVDSNTPPDLDKGVIWILEDITEHKRTQDNLEQAYAELDTFFTNSMFGILVLREGRKIYRLNQRGAEILGYKDANEPIGKSVSEFHLSKKNFDAFGEQFFQSLVHKEAMSVEWPMKRKDGTEVWLKISGKAVDTNTPADLKKGVVWVFDDITASRINEQRLIEIATIDALTQVNNRRHFLELAQREFAINQRHQRTLSVLMLDLDYFKSINDQHGHDVGDKALVAFAKLCNENLRQGDIFGRMGGEEFAAILPDTGIDQARQTAERIRSGLESSSRKEGSPIPPLTVSIGVTSAGPDKSLPDALKQSDLALYQAKRAGRNQVICS